MQPADPLETAVWIIDQLAAILAVVMAYRRGVLAQYRYFCLYLGVGAVAAAILFYFRNISPSMNRYAQVYIWWGYLAPIFYLLAITEVLRLTLGRYPAIELASKRLLRLVWVGLAIFGFTWYYYLVSVSAVPFAKLSAALSYQQAATTGFGLFVLVFLGFVAFMPVPMSPSRLRHCFLLGGVFLVMGAARLIVLLDTNFLNGRAISSYFAMFGSTILLGLWALKMQAEALDAPLATAKGVLDRETAEEYLARMETLNAAVARSGPRFLR